MAIVHLPRSLVTLFPDPPPRQIEVEAPDVGALVRELDQRWPGMWDRVCEPGPRIRVYINVFVDGERGSIGSALGPRSVVHIIPAVAGG